uniref:Tudor-knot domain-containing protein n=1 Tax=Steinernema glaseri TaxID=37863 RepID=A0A1I8AT57_9BILA
MHVRWHKGEWVKNNVIYYDLGEDQLEEKQANEGSVRHWAHKVITADGHNRVDGAEENPASTSTESALFSTRNSPKSEERLQSHRWEERRSQSRDLEQNCLHVEGKTENHKLKKPVDSCSGPNTFDLSD